MPILAAVGSLSFGMTFMFGPLSGILCDQFGLRVTIIIGTIISVAGVLTTSFCSQLYQLYITYGVLWGCGSSLCYTASFVALGRYFHKRISFVNGLATAGSGIGGLGLTPLINYLLSEYDWRYTYQILSAVCASLALCGILVRPVDPSKSKSKISCCFRKKKNIKSRDSDISILQRVQKHEKSTAVSNAVKETQKPLTLERKGSNLRTNNNKDDKKKFSIRFEDEVVLSELQRRNDKLSEAEEVKESTSNSSNETLPEAKVIRERTSSSSSSSKDEVDGIVLDLDYGKTDDIEIGQCPINSTTTLPQQQNRRLKCNISCSCWQKVTSCLDFSNWKKKSYVAWVFSAAVIEFCYFTPYIYLVGILINYSDSGGLLYFRSRSF